MPNHDFKPGQKLVRIVEGRATSAGHKYIVIEYDFNHDGKPVLVADGGFIKELLTDENINEFQVDQQNPVENIGMANSK